MEYTFDWTWFFIGFIGVCVGVAFMRWHRVIADNMGSGVGSYERYRLWAFITLGVSLLVMLNIHSLVFGWLFTMIFNR